jgi:hypothetical protein
MILRNNPLNSKGSLLVILFAVISVQICLGQHYVIRNVNLISMEREGVIPNKDILVMDGRIIKVGTNITAPKTAEVINGKGKYLIPGFFDMHTHFYYEQGDNTETNELELKLMLANGITTVRIANGDQVYLKARQNINEGKWVGPEMIVTSPQLVGSWPWGGIMFAGMCKTPQQADSLVRSYKAQGYDQIKLTFMIKPDVYEAVQKTAKEVGIKVMGHVGPLVKLPKALEAGQQIEHMDEFIDMLLPDETYNHGQSVSDMNLWRKEAWETVPHLDESRINSLVSQVKNAGSYVTPTNYFFYSFFGMGINEEEEKAKPSYNYIPSVLKKYAWDVREKYWSNPPPEESRLKYLSIRKKLITELWKAGVPLMAGSDSPQWFTVSGFALHEELENLVRCGLTPYAALQTATINPARYMGFDNRTGTIAVGKEPDLILLEKNPLEDIRNTRTILGVMNQSKWFDRTALNWFLQDAKVLGK